MIFTFFFSLNIRLYHPLKIYILHPYDYYKGHKFSTNHFVRNFLQPTYKNDMCHLSM
jgi:hypothetical protein